MSEDGDKKAFHKKCDNKGPTLCLFKIKDKDIRYGGFASVSWDSNSNENRDENAFIFSINKKKCLNQPIMIALFIVAQVMDHSLEAIQAQNMLSYGFLQEVVVDFTKIKYIKI